jgi:hypothetical protein
MVRLRNNLINRIRITFYTIKNKTVTVTDLPPGRWTQDYKEHLEKMKEQGTVSDPFLDIPPVSADSQEEQASFMLKAL